ncbi:MAG: 1-acyl-sn-glycerol-3-phosphate acyltransferase [Tagaea sp. CACIAM 22H2]|nr:1-acyl-sn-glycerol-3-phosphate acyltransferase [Tagaea sp. CACIAM 22H2]
MIAYTRSLLFNIWFFGITILSLIGSLPLFLLPRVCVNRLARGWAWLVCLGLRVFLGVTIELRGQVELLRQPGLIASKHQSAWDTLYFYLVCPDPTYVMKKELMRIPIYGWLARKQKMIPVDRKGGGKALKRMIDAATRAIADGRQIVIFPQGTQREAGRADIRLSLSAGYGRALRQTQRALHAGRAEFGSGLGKAQLPQTSRHDPRRSFGRDRPRHAARRLHARDRNAH